MKHHEYDLQVNVCRYLNLQYPKVLYLSDTIANIKLTPIQAYRNSNIQKKWFKCPDLIILEPNLNYKGLFIELKISSPFKKDGTIKSNEHLKEQLNTINELNYKGYYSCFCWSFDMAKEIIDKYFQNKL